MNNPLDKEVFENYYFNMTEEEKEEYDKRLLYRNDKEVKKGYSKPLDAAKEIEIIERLERKRISRM